MPPSRADSDMGRPYAGHKRAATRYSSRVCAALCQFSCDIAYSLSPAASSETRALRETPRARWSRHARLSGITMPAGWTDAHPVSPLTMPPHRGLLRRRSRGRPGPEPPCVSPRAPYDAVWRPPGLGTAPLPECVLGTVARTHVAGLAELCELAALQSLRLPPVRSRHRSRTLLSAAGISRLARSPKQRSAAGRCGRPLDGQRRVSSSTASKSRRSNASNRPLESLNGAPDATRPRASRAPARSPLQRSRLGRLTTRTEHVASCARGCSARCRAAAGACPCFGSRDSVRANAVGSCTSTSARCPRSPRLRGPIGSLGRRSSSTQFGKDRANSCRSWSIHSSLSRGIGSASSQRPASP